MKIDFDPAKDAANVSKHGISLALAADLEWGSALTWPDVRSAYGEPRQCGLVYIGLRLFFVAFVDRVDGRRVISLRKANARGETLCRNLSLEQSFRRRKRMRPSRQRPCRILMPCR
jgi:uncharacterized DUF497 family protein